ncbi:type I restriction enzyme, S subunit, partial [Mycoplasmopsis verecunda]
MTPDQLKKSILNYATSGKLTNQLDTDTDVNVLLEQIAKQKQELIDKKEIKASKNNYHIYKQDNKWYEEVSGKITDITDQIPYEIPKCWTWVR